MKAIVQRVSSAQVTVDNIIVGRISKGLLIFLGIAPKNSMTNVTKLADKVLNLRIFNNNRINLSINDIRGSLLIVSQFTLYADCIKGNRPSFANAASPVHAKKIYNEFVNYMVHKKIKVQSGTFGSHMEVNLINSGPATFILTV